MQQTPVRFYITQNDDQPIVRTIPVTTHPIPQAPKPTQSVQASAPATEKRSRVAKLVRSAVKRSGSAR